MSKSRRRLCAIAAIAALASAQPGALSAQEKPAPTQTAPALPTQPATTPTSLPATTNSLAHVRDEKIRDAMARGSDALLKMVTRFEAAVDWKRPPEAQEQDKAELAMGVYALLVMHQSTGDKRLKFDSREMAPLVLAVQRMRSHYTYAVAWQAMALSMLPGRDEFRHGLSAVRDQLWSGSMDGAYSYEVPIVNRIKQVDGAERVEMIEGNRGRRAEPWDNSNSQYGLLGMWACSDAGVEVPDKYWQQVDTHWRGCQGPSGDFPYVQFGGRTYPSIYGTVPSMTAAGVANLFVVMDKIDTQVRQEAFKDKAIEDGVARLEKDMMAAKVRLGVDLYMAFSVERAGLATGLKRLGGVDWYREGASAIMQRQSREGSWEYHKSTIAGTSYALLFLARGRAPVVFNKLMYPGPWSVRPRDAARVTRYLAGTSELMLNWQIADLRAPGGEDGTSWLDEAPVLLITGKGDPKFTAADLKKMRDFAEAGGLIVSSADNNDDTFTAAIKGKYAPAICGKKYEMRPLPEDHPLFRMNAKVTPGSVKLMGLSNGVRELWVHSPGDMAGAWQANRPDADRGYWDVPVNLLSYVSGREPLRSRVEPLQIARIGAMKSQITVGRLIFNGNDNPEPAAWPRFSRRVGARWGVDLQAVPVRATEIHARIPVLHMMGTGMITMSAPDKKLLRDYVRAGGTLIAEPAGGDELFAKSFEALMTDVLPEGMLETVRADHPVWTGKFDAGITVDPKPRRFVAQPENAPRKLALREMKLGDRPAVLLFTGDLSSGFLGTHTWGIYGWGPTSSEGIMWNAIRYLTAKPK